MIFLLFLSLFLLGAGKTNKEVVELGNREGNREGNSSKAVNTLGLPSQFNCQPSNNIKICLLCNCYHEARGESVAGQVAVARTVFSRQMSSSYENTACGVVYQPWQFSWTLSSAKRSEVLGVGSGGRRFDRAGFNRCMQSTSQVLSSRNHQSSWFASHYHTTSIRPYWASNCRGRSRVGSHYFYTSCDGVGPSNNRNNPSGHSDAVAKHLNKREQ